LLYVLIIAQFSEEVNCVFAEKMKKSRGIYVRNAKCQKPAGSGCNFEKFVLCSWKSEVHPNETM
jgi:hypothetical protein